MPKHLVQLQHPCSDRRPGGQPGTDGDSSGASINDNGNVAFVGNFAGGQAIAVGDSEYAFSNVTGAPGGASELFGAGVQINNNDQIGAAERFVYAGAEGGVAQIWNGDTTGASITIGQAQTPNPPAGWFDAIPLSTSITQNGYLAFAGFNAASNAYEIHMSNALVQQGQNNDPTLVTSLLAGTDFQLMAANGTTGAAAVPANFLVLGRSRGSTQSIDLWEQVFVAGPSRWVDDSIATTSSGNWSDLGIQAGVDDDDVVAFSGDIPSAAAAANLNTQNAAAASADGSFQLNQLTPGPGIFVSIPTDVNLLNRVIVRIAGVSGSGYLNPGETGQNNTDVRTVLCLP